MGQKCLKRKWLTHEGSGSLSSVERTSQRCVLLNPLELNFNRIASTLEVFVTFQRRNSCCIAVMLSWARAQMFCVWYIYVCVVYFFKVGKERKKSFRMVQWSVGKVGDSGFENGSHSAHLLPYPPSDCSKTDDSTESLCIRFYCSGP